MRSSSSDAVTRTARGRVPRWLRFAITVVIAGPVLTVLTAWGLAAWMPRGQLTAGSEGDGAVGLRSPIERAGIRPTMIGAESSIGVRFAYVFVDVPPSWRGEQSMGPEPTGQIESGDQSSAIVSRDLSNLAEMNVIQTGWPRVALHAQTLCGWRGGEYCCSGPVYVPPAPPPIEVLKAHGLVVPALWQPTDLDFLSLVAGAPQTALRLRRPIPIRPMWPGFLVNSLFWGLLTGAVFFVPGVIRRSVRRGRCVGCGYELAGLGRCPECGEVATASA